MNIEMMEEGQGGENRKETFFKKNHRKSFGSSKIVLTFVSAFAKKAAKKRSLKDLDINKQVVQD